MSVKKKNQTAWKKNGYNTQIVITYKKQYQIVTKCMKKH